MAGTFKIDTTNFIKALRAYKAATNKDAAEVLNRAARNVAFRSASFTPKGRSNQIRAALMRDEHLRYALTSIALKKRGVGMLKSPEFRKEVERFVSQRASSANYLRAGWANAIQQLGGSFRGAKFKGAGGFANKATVAKLLAEIVNTVSQPNSAHAAGAELIGSKALAQAVEFVAEDMINYSRQLMGMTATKFSSK
jgi:hypothetical protein